MASVGVAFQPVTPSPLPQVPCFLGGSRSVHYTRRSCRPEGARPLRTGQSQLQPLLSEAEATAVGPEKFRELCPFPHVKQGDLECVN